MHIYILFLSPSTNKHAHAYFDQIEVKRCYLLGISKISSCMAAVSAILLLLLIILNFQSPPQDISVTVMVNILFHPLAFQDNLKRS